VQPVPSWQRSVVPSLCDPLPPARRRGWQRTGASEERGRGSAGQPGQPARGSAWEGAGSCEPRRRVSDLRGRGEWSAGHLPLSGGSCRGPAGPASAAVAPSSPSSSASSRGSGACPPGHSSSGLRGSRSPLACAEPLRQEEEGAGGTGRLSGRSCCMPRAPALRAAAGGSRRTRRSRGALRSAVCPRSTMDPRAFRELGVSLQQKAGSR